MLSRIKITNYRCFPSLIADLRPLTVLIGANNSGKSAFLAAVQALQPDAKFEATDYWRLNEQSTIQILGWPKGRVEPLVTESTKLSRPLFEKAKTLKQEQLGEISLFRLPSWGIACRSEGFDESVKSLPLLEQGEHLASILDYLLREDRKRFDGVVAMLRSLVEGFEDLRIKSPNKNTRRLGVVLDNGLELPGEALSVGLRHMIFFATLAHHPRAPEIILIEEPELGVHPKRLGDIMKLLRSITQGEFCDHPAQVILTTHSPFLLDHVNLDEDQLLIFERGPGGDGARMAYPADKDRLRVFLDEFMLGEVWINEGEAGLLGAQGK